MNEENNYKENSNLLTKHCTDAIKLWLLFFIFFISSLFFHVGSLNKTTLMTTTATTTTTTTTTTTSRPPTQCEKQRQASRQLSSKYVPRCLPNGEFDALQCRSQPSDMDCWCSDLEGSEIHNTALGAGVIPDCDTGESSDC